MSEEKSLATEIIADQQHNMDSLIDELDSNYRQMAIIRKVSKLEAGDWEDAAKIEQIYDVIFKSNQKPQEDDEPVKPAYKTMIHALTDDLDDNIDGDFLQAIYTFLRRHIERKEAKEEAATTE